MRERVCFEGDDQAFVVLKDGWPQFFGVARGSEIEDIRTMVDASGLKVCHEPMRGMERFRATDFDVVEAQFEPRTIWVRVAEPELVVRQFEGEEL